MSTYQSDLLHFSPWSSYSNRQSRSLETCKKSILQDIADIPYSHQDNIHFHILYRPFLVTNHRNHNGRSHNPHKYWKELGQTSWDSTHSFSPHYKFRYPGSTCSHPVCSLQSRINKYKADPSHKFHKGTHKTLNRLKSLHPKSTLLSTPNSSFQLYTCYNR